MITKKSENKNKEPVKTYAESAFVAKKVYKQDETDYLLASPANKAMLDLSIAEGKRGEFYDCELYY